MASREKVYYIGMVGAHECGGSSLLKRISKNTFTESLIDLNTMPTSIVTRRVHAERTYLLSIFTPQIGRECLGYQVDFPCSDVDHSRCSHACALVVCFDVQRRLEFAQLPRLLQKIKRHCRLGSVPLLLVATKIDMSAERQVSTEDGKKFADAHSMTYIETSAKTDTNCEEVLRKALALIAVNEKKVM